MANLALESAALREAIRVREFLKLANLQVGNNVHGVSQRDGANNAFCVSSCRVPPFHAVRALAHEIHMGKKPNVQRFI